MATMDELKKEIVEVSKDLGIKQSDVKFSDSHDGLSKQLSELKQAAKAKADSENAAAEAAEAQVRAAKERAEALEAANAAKFEGVDYIVAQGVSISGKSGKHIMEGEPITVAMLAGGEKALKILVERKKIIKIK